nr:immunoglobulin light chain junction region [Macaca mulatta]MOX11059.1 immunoglobulin light chain junction region [Macaca mulatta]
YMQALEFPFTF